MILSAWRRGTERALRPGTRPRLQAGRPKKSHPPEPWHVSLVGCCGSWASPHLPLGRRSRLSTTKPPPRATISGSCFSLRYSLRATYNPNCSGVECYPKPVPSQIHGRQLAVKFSRSAALVRGWLLDSCQPAPPVTGRPIAGTVLELLPCKWRSK
jgi:hypothetical protein